MEDILYAWERREMSRMMLKLVQHFHQFYHGSMFMGTAADTLFCALVVFIADTEEKPISATGVASFLGMQRSTALRRLNRLCEGPPKLLKRVGMNYVLSDELIASQQRADFHEHLRRCFSAIITTAKTLAESRLMCESHTKPVG